MVRISVQLVGSARQELELLQGGCSVSLQHSASCIGWFRPVMLAACNACACYLSAAPAFDLGGGASATGWARLQSSPLRTETGAQGHGTARGWQGHHHSARWRLVGLVRGCLVAPHPQPWLAGIKMLASTMSKRCREQQSASLTCALHVAVVVVADTLLAMPYRTAPPANIVSAAISARSGQSSCSRQEDDEDEEPDEPARLPAGATWAHRSCTAGPTIPSPPLMALHGQERSCQLLESLAKQL